MLRYQMLEIRRAIVSTQFLVGLSLAALGVVTWMLPELGGGDASGALYLFRRSYNGYISLLAPVLATIPFAASYAIERNGGFSRYVLLRCRGSSYLTMKLISGVVAGGLVLAAPFAGAVLWLTARYPLVTANTPERHAPLFVTGTYTPEPLAFMWILVAISFLFGATYATLGLASSVLLRNPYYAHIVPFAVYIIGGMLLGGLGLAYLEPSEMWTLSNTYTTPLSFGMQYAVFWIVSLVVLVRFFRFKEEE